MRQVVFQHTAARRRLIAYCCSPPANDAVSTHSRPKAAEAINPNIPAKLLMFQHTAARRRLIGQAGEIKLPEIVSTHSRPKAAEICDVKNTEYLSVSTHSRPKAAEFGVKGLQNYGLLFQHTAARRRLTVTHAQDFVTHAVSTHSRPKAAEGVAFVVYLGRQLFQHTAARRRLNGSKACRS